MAYVHIYAVSEHVWYVCYCVHVWCLSMCTRVVCAHVWCVHMCSVCDAAAVPLPPPHALLPSAMAFACFLLLFVPKVSSGHPGTPPISDLLFLVGP